MEPTDLRRAILATCLFALIGLASACCVVSNGAKVMLGEESVIIVWDEAHQIEHFVRRARFDTRAENFGFIVPTPSVPTLAVADPQAFGRLESLVPKEPTAGTEGFAGGDKEAATGGVEVIRTERVGDYDAAIVRATDGKALNEWLKKNGYVSRPAMEEWLQFYAKKSWVFTAFKFANRETTGTLTQPIRVSFKTERPQYPYKMPEDTWPSGWRRPMNLYFVAASAVQSRYVDSDANWEAQVRWKGPLPAPMRGPLAKDLALKESDLPPNAVVTVFQNGENPDGYGRDLYFASTSNLNTWIWGGAAAAIFIVVVMLRRRAPLHPAPA